MNHGLNPEQKSAVETLSGPMLVLAGAGSGKTRVVTFRIANLIKHGTSPDRILAVTFTNKAAKEMRERISKMLPKAKRGTPRGQRPPTPVIGTFHSNCVQILRRHAKHLGYPEKFAIYDRSDQESVAREVLRKLHVHSGMLKPGDFLSHISRWKNASVRPDQAGALARTDAEHVAATGYGRYQQAIKASGAMDFDDLLLLTEELFRSCPEVLKEEAGQYDHILVDEYQDTNQSQYEIIRQLAGGHRNLCVVGDDDQSIYAWRGAEVRHILNFNKDWPEAKLVRLEANYRSTAAILETANRIIAFNSVRHDKVLRAARMGGTPPRILQFKSETAEAEGICQEIQFVLSQKRREPRDFAILFRTNEQPRVFETELRKAGIPYSLVGTQSFFDRREIRDLLCYLRVIDNPRDEVSLLRIINSPPRGIGTKTIQSLLDKAVKEGSSVWDVMKDTGVSSSLPAAAKRGSESLQGIVGRHQRVLHGRLRSLSESLRDLLQDLDFFSAIERAYPKPEEAMMRKDSIEELVNAIAEYEQSAGEQASLAGFLDGVALAGKEFGGGKEKDRGNGVSLMTYHSAKGLEFPIVFMVGMEEGILPHRRSVADDDVEEERRLCYVGITRAQDELTLSLPLIRKKWGKERETFASRFLYEMTGQADNPKRLKNIAAARKEALYGGRKPPSGPKKPASKKSPQSKTKAVQPRPRKMR